jgi:hypothetical protein
MIGQHFAAVAPLLHRPWAARITPSIADSEHRRQNAGRPQLVFGGIRHGDSNHVRAAASAARQPGAVPRRRIVSQDLDRLPKFLQGDCGCSAAPRFADQILSDLILLFVADARPTRLHCALTQQMPGRRHCGH